MIKLKLSFDIDILKKIDDVDLECYEDDLINEIKDLKEENAYRFNNFKFKEVD